MVSPVSTKKLASRIDVKIFDVDPGVTTAVQLAAYLDMRDFKSALVIFYAHVGTPDLNLFRLFTNRPLAQHCLQSGEQLRASFVIQFRFTFGRHVIGIDGLHHFLDKLWLLKELFRRPDLLEIDFPVHFLSAVALCAFLSEKRLQEVVKVTGLTSRRDGAEGKRK